MAQRRLIKVRFYRDTIGDLQIPDVALHISAMRDIIHAVILQLKSHQNDGRNGICAEILDETGILLERIIWSSEGIRLAGTEEPRFL